MNHYNDTFEHLMYHWKMRNRVFIFILILLGVIVLDLVSPGLISKGVNAYIIKSLDLKIDDQNATVIDLSVINAGIWFVLLSLVVNYYQRSIFVDRTYHYIDKIERQLCLLMEGDFITREGKAYKSRTGIYKNDKEKRPIFLRTVGPLYTFIFPLLLCFITIWKLKSQNLPPASPMQYFDLIVGIVLIGYNIFYLLWVLKKA